MEITRELLKEKYAEYNKLYFDGKLGKCVFGFIQSYNDGAGGFTVKKDRNGRKYGCIRLSKCVLWNENLFREVLVHEMIHMYNHLVEMGLAATWPFNGLFYHGFFFKRQCRRIKRKHNLKVFATIPVFNPIPYKKKIHDSLLNRVVSKILGC